MKKFAVRYPFLFGILVTLAAVFGQLWPFWIPGLSQSVHILLARATNIATVVFLLTWFKWWRDAGFVRIQSWKTLLPYLPLALLVAVGCMHDRSGAPTAAAPATSPSLFASKVSQVPGGPPPIILRTDKSDYSPGETVVITGQGWKPGRRCASRH